MQSAKLKRGGRVRAGRNARRDSNRVIESRDIHSKLDGRPAGTHSNHRHNLHGTSATAVVAGAAGFYECAIIEETRETHVVPRQSQSRKQLLGIFPPKIETESRKARQLDKGKYDGKAETVEAAIKQGMVETTDNRQVYRSDRTLLRRGNPFDQTSAGIKREGSVSVGLNKRRTFVPDRDVDRKFDPDGTVIGPAIDGVKLD